ncbi:membrane protein [Pararhizobium polonicum]|uniref:Membrane protein n=1 Tax=Pararhizobium polonicum TaxID=1612624 RepID=A0A1C7NX67_9HYPH|nr:FxsA family protein [Pararhizobium polonicum]OBZ93600.1 membrane protein [Pararhizobium polonicum]
MRSLTIPILFLLMPLAEIATFIFVGREVGVGMTLLLVLASAIAGAVLLRVQGLGVLRNIQQASQAGSDPGHQLVHGVMIVVAAFLLIIPGFISDIIGLLLFIPAVRDLGWSFLKSRLTIITTRAAAGARGFSRGRTSNSETSRHTGSPVIDLDDDEFSRTDGRGRTDPNERDRLK